MMAGDRLKELGGDQVGCLPSTAIACRVFTASIAGASWPQQGGKRSHEWGARVRESCFHLPRVGVRAS